MTTNSTTNTGRIRKVYVIRIPAEGGQLTDDSQFLMEETTIIAAKAGLENYWRIISAADYKVQEGKTPVDHYPQTARFHVPELENEENIEVWDLFLRPDYWYSSEQVLLERVFIKVAR